MVVRIGSTVAPRLMEAKRVSLHLGPQGLVTNITGPRIQNHCGSGQTFVQGGQRCSIPPKAHLMQPRRFPGPSERYPRSFALTNAGSSSFYSCQVGTHGTSGLWQREVLLDPCKRKTKQRGAPVRFALL